MRSYSTIKVKVERIVKKKKLLFKKRGLRKSRRESKKRKKEGMTIKGSDPGFQRNVNKFAPTRARDVAVGLVINQMRFQVNEELPV